MKIIGKVNDRTWLCQVERDEVEKFLGLYYRKMTNPEVGETIDLGKGHDYSSEINAAMRKTQEFIEANKKIVEAILNGLSVIP